MNWARKYYEIWSGNHLWSNWTKPVLFASGIKESNCEPNRDNAEILLNLSNRLVNDSGLSKIFPRAEDGTGCCIIIDYPGKLSLGMGVVLSRQGFAPVVLFNGVMRPEKYNFYEGEKKVEALVNNDESVKALVDLSLYLADLPTETTPVFLLDSARQNGDPQPDFYDNRWITFPQDFPSGKMLVSQGIRKCFLLTESRRVSKDLCHVLFRWQQDGIEFFMENCGQLEVTQIPKPSRFGNIFYRISVLAGLKPHSFGGFGGIVPDPSQGGYG